jgi:prevent-host-death family protein
MHNVRITLKHSQLSQLYGKLPGIFGKKSAKLSQQDLVPIGREIMKTVNIHEAKTQLSKLVDEASKGESFIIAKAGKPIVKVTALSAPASSQVRRLGFLAGQISVPDDFDQMGRDEIEGLFGSGV